MSSPRTDQPNPPSQSAPAASATTTTNTTTERPEVDADEEMEDQNPDNSTGTIQNTSSSTIEAEPSSQTQGEAQQTTGTSTFSHHNRKDVSLREFLSKMDDYAPIIPDAVTAHYLTMSGLPPPSSHDPSGATTNTTPLPLARLLALATQKFIADIAADAYQYSRIRASNSAAANNPLGSTVLPGQAGAAGGAGGAGGSGGAGGKGGQNATQLGVQRSGYGGGGQGGSGQGRTVLTMEDLGMAVHEYGVNVKRGEFYR